MAWQSPYDSPYPNAGPNSPMNGFKDQNLDEDAFGPAPSNIVSAFDAFRTSCPALPFTNQTERRVPQANMCPVPSQPNQNPNMSPGPPAVGNGPSP